MRGIGHLECPRPFVKGSIDCSHLWMFVMPRYEEYCNELPCDKSHVLCDPCVSNMKGPRSGGLGSGTLKNVNKGRPSHPEKQDRKFFVLEQI